MPALIAAAAAGAIVAGLFAVWSRRERDKRLANVLEEVGPVQGDDRDRPSESLEQRVSGSLSRLIEERDRAVADRSRLEQAVERMPEAIVVCDAEGRVVFSNQAGAQLSDARHEDALVAAAVTECLRAALGGEPGPRSVELFGPPPRTITVEAEPLGGGARPSGAVATVADRSRLRRLESVRSDFVANVSHELKTPVGGLALLAESLSESLEAGDDQRLADRLLHEAHRLGRVVDDLLALSEIESSASDRVELVDLADLINRVTAGIDVLGEAHGVEVERGDVEGDLAVEGDPRYLTSALSNVVENAIKYSDGASPVTVSAESAGDVVLITVRDHGIGIPRRDLDRVFERFYRVDQARSRATGGTGLGLAIVRNVVRAHGGDVELTSREGEGTQVAIRLPRAGIDTGSSMMGATRE